ncbi:MAG: hypothetical protein U0805_04945 [Pirellulales bacterium]
MDKATRMIIDAKYNRCVERSVHRLRRFSVKELLADDSPMRTLWDLWKFEVQHQHSIIHCDIKFTVESIVGKVVRELRPEDVGLLTLATNAADNLDEEFDGPLHAPDAVFSELMSRINTRAVNEPHRREVQRQLDAEDLDRHERDMEPYLGRKRGQAPKHN